MSFKGPFQLRLFYDSYQAKSDKTTLQQMQTFALAVPRVKVRAHTQRGYMAEGSLARQDLLVLGSRISNAPAAPALLCRSTPMCSVYIRARLTNSNPQIWVIANVMYAFSLCSTQIWTPPEISLSLDFLYLLASRFPTGRAKIVRCWKQVRNNIRAFSVA